MTETQSLSAGTVLLSKIMQPVGLVELPCGYFHPNPGGYAHQGSTGKEQRVTRTGGRGKGQGLRAFLRVVSASLGPHKTAP